MTTTTIPAARAGEAPYELGTTVTGLFRLSRKLGNREVFLVFGREEGLGIANAIVDRIEAIN